MIPLKTVAVAFFLSLVFAIGFPGSPATASELDEVLKAARKEGKLDFYAPSTLTPQGAQALGDAFTNKYKLNIKFLYHPSGSMGRDISKVITRSTATIEPEWDLMMITDAHHASLWLKKLHEPYDYTKLGVNRNVIHFDSGTVSMAHQFALPAYNSKFVAAKDVPRRWEDLLNTKWKDGKLGVSVATHHFARLAIVWGEEKATKFVKELANQKPNIGELGALYSRLLIGEVEMTANMTDSFIHRAKQDRAPIMFAEDVQPIIASAYQVGVIKNATNPNLARLFTAFLVTPEAQKILEKYSGHSSVFVPGTSYHKYAQGKQLIHMTQDQAEMVDKLRAEYYKILGFTPN